MIFSITTIYGINCRYKLQFLEEIGACGNDCPFFKTGNIFLCTASLEEFLELLLKQGR